MASIHSIGKVALCAFFVSGMSGLVHEIVWTRLLRHVMGNTTFAITTVLCVFMAGLALGSYFGGRMADSRKRPLRLFALLETAIAMYCVLLPWMIDATEPIYRYLYQNTESSFYTLSLVRFLFCGLLLVVPAALMGATLPVLSRFFVRSAREIGLAVGNLYAVNTFGAVVGVSAAGFVLIPHLGVMKTLYIACLLNLAVGGASFWLHRRSIRWLGPDGMAGTPSAPAQRRKKRSRERTADEASPVYGTGALAVVLVGYAASGCAALVYEIAWTRVLSLVIGSSVYAFSMMLTAFILGLALGSVICARFVDRVADPMRALGVIQVSIGISAALVVPLLGRLPLGLTGVIARASASFWQLQAVEFLVILAIMIVPTTLMGAAFPLAMRLFVQDVQRAGRSVGTLYAFNTVGSILGAFAGGFVLIPLLGIQHTLLAAVLLNLATGCAFFAASQNFAPLRRGWAIALVVAAAVILAAVIPPWDPLVMTFGPFIQARRLGPEVLGSRRELERLANRPKVIFHEEDYATTVTVKEYPNAVRVISVNAKPDASSTGDLPTQQLLAHVPLLLHPNPKSALVIGLASGITLGSAGLHPLETLDCAEISPSMIRACRFFDDYNHRILDDPRVRIHTADGRNHLALTSRQYDVIISEPSNPWIAGIGDLFTEEFFQLCRHRLTDHGIACIWLETYNIDLASFQSVVSTFGAVFPEMTIWSTTPADVLLVGSKDRIRFDYEAIADRINRQSIKSDVVRIGIESAADFLGYLMMRGEGAMRLAAGAPIHTDDNAILEFAAPRVLVRNVAESATVDALVEHRDADRTFAVGPDDVERVQKIKGDAVRNVRAKGHILRSRAHTRAQRHAEAIDELRAAALLNRSDAWLKELLDEGLARANALVGRLQYAEAASALRELLSVDSRFPGALNGLALLLATHPDPASRNAPQAVRMAEQLCEVTANRNADYLHTLSIAYGAAGRVEDAANRARQALQIAQQTGNEALSKTLRTKLEQFEQYRSRGAN